MSRTVYHGQITKILRNYSNNSKGSAFYKSLYNFLISLVTHCKNTYVKLKIFERCCFAIFKHLKKILQGSGRNLLQIKIGNMYLNQRKQIRKSQMQYH